MPAETDRHERTLMGWPTCTREQSLWRGHLAIARRAWAEVAATIARFEPVTMAVACGELDDGGPDSASVLLEGQPGIDLVELPLDDSWLRDHGPIVVRNPATGARRARHFGFNAWGGKYEPYEADAEVAGRLAENLGLPVDRIDFVLEGGSIAVDGEGLLITTERCLLHSNRGPLPGGAPRTHEGVERALADSLGIDRVVWLPDALTDDDGTDGHIDNVVAVPAPGRVLLQGCADPADPDHVIAAENRRRLEVAGLEVTELTVLARARCLDREVEVPYGNLYACNGAVIVPVTGHPYDDEALAVIGRLYPGREVVPVPGAVIAYGGGGPHCITQQVPA
jgi:agmatine deiminase